VVEGLKLYFFYSAANRDAYLMARSAAVADAEKNWPKLRDSLSGPNSETPASTALTAANAETSAAASAPADPAAAGAPTAEAAPGVAPAAADGNVHSN
jgi:hypothetical protein